MERQSTSARRIKPRAQLRTGWVWMCLIAALLWFLPLNTPHLFDPDEGRYGEIPREMVASGDWVTPRLDGIKYFEKPALQYWATAVAFELFGEHAWTVRLWPALCGFVGLALTFVLGRRLYGLRAACLAALVQASTLLYIAMARIATLDMSLCCTLQLAMSALALLVQPTGPVQRTDAESQDAAPSERDRTMRWALPLLLGLGVALALLTKGLIGIVIPAATALLFMLIYRDARLLLRARPWLTIAVLLAVASPWFIIVSLRNHEFAQFFFIFEHFQRYLSRAQFERYQPGWFFIPVLLAGFLPWSGVLPRTLIEAVRAARRGERATGLLLIWAAFVFLFFSLSQSKLIPYVLPLWPALALLVGRELARWEPRRLAWHLAAAAIGAAIVLVAVLVLWQLPATAYAVAQASNASLLALAAACGLLAAGAALGARRSRRGHPLSGAAFVAVGVLCCAQLVLFGADRLPRMQSMLAAVERLRPVVADATPFYCVGFYPQPLPFYLRRTCTLVGYRGELDFGLRQEPQREVDPLAEFARLWRRQRAAAAVVTPADYRRLEALGAPMRVIYTAPSIMVIVNSQ